MTALNLFLTPPTAAEIAAKREEARFENSPAFKAGMFTPPIMGLDLLAGLATAAVDHAIRGDRSEPWEDAVGALDRPEWEQSFVTRRYVGKVREMGRELVKGEVRDLLGFLSSQKTADQLAAFASEAAADAAQRAGRAAHEAAREAAKNATLQAAEGLKSGVRDALGASGLGFLAKAFDAAQKASEPGAGPQPSDIGAQGKGAQERGASAAPERQAPKTDNAGDAPAHK
jgi:hypothetical protein